MPMIGYRWRLHDAQHTNPRSLRALEREPPGTAGMKRFIRRKFEAWLILLAAKILMDRNVQRSPVVSRRDNSDMWAMAEKLEAIVTRIRKKYQ